MINASIGSVSNLWQIGVRTRSGFFVMLRADDTSNDGFRELDYRILTAAKVIIREDRSPNLPTSRRTVADAPVPWAPQHRAVR